MFFYSYLFQVSEADFRDSVLTLGFSQDQQEILSKFYESKQKDVNEVLSKSLNEPHYEDLKWRFEAQVCYFLLLSNCFENFKTINFTSLCTKS